jgi:hypothetical protein
VDGATTVTFPAGFTQLATQARTGDGQQSAVAWKRLTGADSGTYTVSWTGSNEAMIQAFAFSGRHATDPPTISTTAGNNTGNTSPVSIAANGVTNLAGDDNLWISAPDIWVGGAWSHTAPTGYTKQEDTTADFDCLCGATKENVSAGATGTVTGTLTLSGKQASWSAWLVRLPVASGGGGSRGVFMTPPLNGVGGGGSFFRDPLAAPRT